jgi:hypothetical protein
MFNLKFFIMKDLKLNQITPLQIDEMAVINGGGSIFNEIGAAAHTIWCSVKEAWQEFKNTPSSGHGGVVGMNTY